MLMSLYLTPRHKGCQRSETYPVWDETVVAEFKQYFEQVVMDLILKSN